MRPVGHILCAALLVVLAVTGTGPTLAVAQKLFTAQEKAALAAGKLVVRPATRRRGNLTLVGGLSWQVINLPPDAVWRAVTDFANYRKFVPAVEVSRVTEHKSPVSIVYVEHERGPISVDYFMKMTVDHKNRTAEFQLDKSRRHDIDEGWGFFIVTPYGENRSMVSYGIYSDAGGGLIAGIVRPQVERWTLRVPAELKKYIEGSGRKLYAREPVRKAF